MRQTKGWGANLASQCNYIWPSHRAPQQEEKKKEIYTVYTTIYNEEQTL